MDADNQNAQPSRPCPILISLDNAADTRSILDKCKLLAANKVYEKVYVKCDTHPLIRKEWSRLRALVKVEKEAPINVGCEIKLDYKAKTVTRDGVVIDRFVSPFPK